MSLCCNEKSLGHEISCSLFGFTCFCKCIRVKDLRGRCEDWHSSCLKEDSTPMIDVGAFQLSRILMESNHVPNRNREPSSRDR